MGIALAADRKFPAIAAMIFVGFFAIFHGHAHGIEMPDMAKPLLRALGFVVGTAGIHIAGVVIGLVPKKLGHGFSSCVMSVRRSRGLGFT